MKKHLLILIAVVALLAFNTNTSNAQNGNYPLIEYITGTWCGYCPCGHVAIADILTNYPNTMVLAYHGASSDPWQSWTSGIRQILFGSSQSYPTGIVGRRTGVISRSAWNNQVVIQSNLPQFAPGVSIVVNNKLYNSTTRTITANVVLTALSTLTGTYNVMFVLSEDNIVYPQNFYAECGGNGYNNSYIHHHVVKAMINGDMGTALITTDTWTQGNAVTVPLSYTVPTTVVDVNAKVNIFVFKNESPLNVSGFVQQTRQEGVTTPTGIYNQNEIPAIYSLDQNYPNPFNPTTNIKFTIPKEGNVSLKFYDIMGQEIATYVDGILKAGTYNAEFDGSNLASGIYFYTLRTNNFAETKRMSLVK